MTRQIKPGLVALYDIRPGNGAGLFLQPRSLHGAGLFQLQLVVRSTNVTTTTYTMTMFNCNASTVFFTACLNYRPTLP